MLNMQKAFRTKEGLQGVLDNLHTLPEAENAFDAMFFEMYEIDENKLSPVPYWIEQYYLDDNIHVQYMPGYHEPCAIGDIIQIESRDWEYIDTQALGEEVEHQTETGELVYEYRGYSFIRILRAINTS